MNSPEPNHRRRSTVLSRVVDGAVAAAADVSAQGVRPALPQRATPTPPPPKPTDKLAESDIVMLDTAAISTRSDIYNRMSASLNPDTDEQFRQIMESIAHEAEQARARSKDPTIPRAGNLHPILVRPDATKPGTYVLIAGERRYQASKRLRLPVSAIVTDADDARAHQLMIEENIGAKAKNFWELAHTLRSYDLLHASHGAQKGIAARLQLTPRTYRRYVQAGRAPIEIEEVHPDLGTLPFRTVFKLAELEESSPDVLRERIEIARAAKGKRSAAQVTNLLLTGEWLKDKARNTTAAKMVRNERNIALEFADDATAELVHRRLTKILIDLNIKVS